LLYLIAIILATLKTQIGDFMRLPERRFARWSALSVALVANTAFAQEADPLRALPDNVIRQFRSGITVEQMVAQALLPIRTYDVDNDGLDAKDVETAETFGKAAQRASFVHLTLAFDLDGDLKVTAAEAHAAAERQFHGLGEDKIARRFSEIMSPDRDKDGVISIEEMASQEPAASQRRREEGLQDLLRVDPDGDGRLRTTELEALVRAGFAKLDLNGDGVLDRTEVPVPLTP
jgi:Ca2+-binding EF-hand superfamily protein